MKYIRFYILLLISIRLLASDSTKIEFDNLEPEPQHMKVAPLIVKYLTNFPSNSIQDFFGFACMV